MKGGRTDNDSRKNGSRKLKIALKLGAVLLIVLLAGFFSLLIKVKGNFAYVYNFFVETRGSLPVEVCADTDTIETGEGMTEGKLVPHSTENTAPGKFLSKVLINVNGSTVDDYRRKNEISVGPPDLTGHKGILTFRGSYLRDITSFGTVTGNGTSLEKSWEYKTGRFLKDDGVNYWSGNGWTGQPLAVCWDEKWKQYMNLAAEAKSKEDLVEIIYPGMDGKIHFLDMDNGRETREAINVGMIFKGTCSVHPGYPLLVCGSGDSATGLFGEQVSARIFIYSLIDGTKLYEFAANDELATRTWHGFDSSPIFDAESDTVICPGENGVLYTVHLNTAFDEQSGKLTVNPDETVRYVYTSYAAGERYEASENGDGSGSESSAVIWENFLFFGDNGGIFQCLDLSTMKPVWVQDILEDINSSPVLETGDDGQMYIYVGTTLKFHFDSHHIGEACVYKLNAETGEIVWKKPYEVHTVLGLAGGLLSSGASGKGAISDYIFYAVSKTPSVDSGYIVALSKSTGEEYWRMELPCDAWSSGCLIYDPNGRARLIQCCGNGDICLLDAVSGELLDKINFGANIEATPVIYGDRLVVGLRSEYIAGVELK